MQPVARPHPPTPIDLNRPNVVAVVHSPQSLKLALKLDPSAVDLIEIRLDTLPSSLDDLGRTLSLLRHPLILTARHPQEGGQHGLSSAERSALLERFLPFATAIDIELRSVERMPELTKMARDGGVTIIVSHHNFQQTPSPARLHELARRALLARADIFKLAVCADSAADLATLLTFYAKQKRMHLSVMAMGSLGRISRLLFGQMGSVLNYGYLDRAAVPGQWPAELLKRRLEELRK